MASPAFCLGFVTAAPVVAQEGLERWLDDLLPRSLWSMPGQSKGIPAGPVLLEAVPQRAVTASYEVRRTGLGPYALHRHQASAALHQPLADPELTLDLKASHRVDSRFDLDQGALRSDAPSAVEAGVTGRVARWPGRWAFRVGGGWEGDARWSASLAGAGRFHRLVASHERARNEGFRLSLPGPDVEGRSRTASSRSGVAAELRWPEGRFDGSGVEVEWARETFEPLAAAEGSRLDAVIAGSRREVGLEARFRVIEPVLLEVGLRRARIDSDGSVARNGQRAGRLFFGRVRSERWSVALTEPSDETRWRGRVSWGRADGSLSARLETWPFGQIWDQLGAVAYRVRGDLDTRWTAATWSRRAHDGAGWTLGIERVRVGLNGEYWLVTGLGFGRSDQRGLEDLDATVFLLGGGLQLGLPGTEGRGSMRVDASVPVRASWNRAAEEGLGGSEWVGGWSRWADVGVRVSWSSGSF